MKRFLCVITIAAILLISVSCGFSGSKPDSEGIQMLSESSSETSVNGGNSTAAISLSKFKSEITARNLGEIAEINGDFGYDAALVTAKDGTNYIYMYLADPSMAESVLTDSDGNGETDPDFSITAKGNGYVLYTQESESSGSSEAAIYGRCLLAGSMIIVVSGTMDNKERIKKNADAFMKALGYEIS